MKKNKLPKGDKELLQNLDVFISVFGVEDVAQEIYEEILAPLGW